MGQVPCVLVVDDVIDALQTLADILGVAGYAVRTAPSAERALQILGGTSIDLVITDLRMGGMGGMGLIRSLHRDFPDLPVIALSGFADTSTVIQAFREGVVDFLVKPFTAEEVLAAVERALARRRGERPPVPEATAARSPLDPAAQARARAILQDLQRRSGAEFVLLVGAGGELLAAAGMIAGRSAEALAAAIGQMGVWGDRLAELMGEPSFQAQMGEAAQRALYLGRLPEGAWVVCAVPRSIKAGLVWLELREAVSRLGGLWGPPPEAGSSGTESVIPNRPATAAPVGDPLGGWTGEEPGPGGEGLLSYEEARALGLIPDLEEGVDSTAPS